MADKEYIACRDCDSWNCKGCNINTLSKMLENGKFDCLMNDHRSINPTADVVEVRHGEWMKSKDDFYVCSECGTCCQYTPYFDHIEYWECRYCQHCGAKMDGKGEGE